MARALDHPRYASCPTDAMNSGHMHIERRGSKHLCYGRLTAEIGLVLLLYLMSGLRERIPSSRIQCQTASQPKRRSLGGIRRLPRHERFVKLYGCYESCGTLSCMQMHAAKQPCRTIYASHIPACDFPPCISSFLQYEHLKCSLISLDCASCPSTLAVMVSIK